MIRIYRYGNRKYYVPKMGYMNLGEILEVVEGGDQVTVICNKTKNDITERTLAAARFYKQWGSMI